MKQGFGRDGETLPTPGVSKSDRGARRPWILFLSGVHGRGTGDPYSSTTQVSLLPPPWEEFTTSEPLRNATRVNPPGRIVTFSP